MKTIFVMCGLAFAGKSTAARRVAAAFGAGLVSLDGIHVERGLFPGGDLDVATWRETGRIALERTGALLQQGRSVVVDDTFSYRVQRDCFRSLAAVEGADFLILFLDTPEPVMAERIAANRLRPTRGDVLPHVVEFIRQEFQPPAPDEPSVRFADPDDVERWLEGQL